MRSGGARSGGGSNRRRRMFPTSAGRPFVPKLETLCLICCWLSVTRSKKLICVLVAFSFCHSRTSVRESA